MIDILKIVGLIIGSTLGFMAFKYLEGKILKQKANLKAFIPEYLILVVLVCVVYIIFIA